MKTEKKQDNTHLISPSLAWLISSKIRTWMQPPAKILNGQIKEGSIVMDFGCGTGYLTTTIAKQVGENGKVYAVELQAEMIKKLEQYLSKTCEKERVIIHQCDEEKIGLDKKVDTIVTCYVLHEVPNQNSTLKQFYEMLNDKGKFYLVEPPFHVRKNAFKKQIKKAQGAGFKLIKQGKIGLNHMALFEKS